MGTARAPSLSPSHVQAFQTPGSCELIPTTGFDDLAMSNDEALSGAIQHRAEGLRGRGLVHDRG
jgi:hypothetical protein